MTVVDEIAQVLGVSDPVVYALLAFAVLQMGVQIWALVDLVRADQVVGGRKWLWALAIIFLSNLALGAILYLAIGRNVPEPAVEAPAPPDSGRDRTARAVDALYGPSEESEQ